jgi:copper chaperone
MSILKFKTNIKCSGCIATVTPFLNSLNTINNWEVDTLDPDKILTVQGDDVSAQDIVSKLKEAGYTAETIDAES